MSKVEQFVGTTVWFSKSYGFLKRDEKDGEGDIFVHFSAIVSEGFRTLKPGQKVYYSIGQNENGEIAVDVVPIKE